MHDVAADGRGQHDTDRGGRVDDADEVGHGAATVSGQVLLLTGATSGIGRAAAVQLAERGATVVLAGRNRDRGREILESVREAGGDGVFVRADFADPAAVRGLADAVRDRYDRLDVLVNNAGLSLSERRLATGYEEPVETVFAVNHLAPYLLTRELLPLLRTSAPSRVVVTSSGIHPRGELDLGDLTMRDYDARAAYARSKLANVLFTVELAARLRGTGVTANAYDPGFVPGTDLFRDASLGVSAAIAVLSRLPLVGGSAAESASGLVSLAADPALTTVSGAYYSGTERATPDRRARDEALRERLWDVSARLLGVSPAWL